MIGVLPLGALSRLAWRNLWRNHRRTLVMLMAVTVGAWAMIFMTALMRGMVDQMVEDGIDALPGQVQVHHVDFRDDPSIENRVPEPGPRFAAALGMPQAGGWTARVRVPAMISSERDNRGVTLLGVEPAGEVRLGFDPDGVVAGRWLESADDAGVVVGRKLLERLETGLGKRIVVMSQDPENDIAERGFRIVGVYRTRLPALEESFVYVGRETAQAMLGIPGEVTEIAVAGTDYRQVGPLLQRVRAVIGPDEEALPWYELDRYLGAMLGVMDGFVLVWIVVVFLALSFGLVNTLMMAVFERTREFGLMQALGMKPATIRALVLTESLMLLALGLFLGNLAAVASVFPIRDGIDLSIVSQGMEMFGASAVLYPALKVGDLVLANGIVLLLGVLTSLLPAWRASQKRPVEAIARA